MFRAIIPGQLLRGTRSTSVPHHLTEKLLQQFSASPYCSEILVPESNGLMFGNSPKIVPVSDISDHPNTNRLQTLVIGSGSDIEHPRDDVPLSLVILSSIFGSNGKTPALQELSKKFPAARISVFRYSRILCSDAGSDIMKARELKDVCLDSGYPIFSQFLPARYREIEASHLAQAIRLNYETCEPSYCESMKNVEFLDFVDCMKIIGLDEKI